MPERDKQCDEEADTLIMSRDRLLKIDPKRRQGRLTISGERIGAEADEVVAPGANDRQEEN